MGINLNFLKEVKSILSEDFNKIYFIAFFFILSSSLDLISLSLIGAYLALILDRSLILEYSSFTFVNTYLSQLNDFELITYTGLILILVFVVKFLATLLSNFIIYSFSVKRQVKLQQKLMDKYLSQEYESFIQRNSSEYITAISGYARRFKDILQSLLRIFSDMMIFLAVIGALAFISFSTLMILISLFLLLAILWNIFFLSKVQGFGKLFNEGNVLMIKGVSEGISGLKEIKILGKENYFMNHFKRGIKLMASMEVKQMLISITPRSLLELVMVIFVVLVIFLNIYSNQDLTKALMILGVFGVGAVRLVPIISTFLNSLNIIRFGREAVSNIYQDLQGINDILVDSIEQNNQEIVNFKEIELNKVSYNYPGSKDNSLKDISLKVSKGEFIGLVGSSGAGKTTLVDVLLGLLKPNNGNVKVNNLDINENMDSWRSLIAYIPQEIFLIDDTLAENITLGDKNSSEDRLEEAIESSRLSEFVNTLEDGIETMIGERGVRFSGGQRQRVSIARALFHNRKILILDEATSSLDESTEKEIVEQIKSMKGEVTIISIAHRLSTLKYCDKLYLLSGGEISGPYTYDEYVKNLGESVD
tara:strand:+ start:10287 stop:12059 length:1773 start_codon:yes stop_codon:yes gene_type:complete